MTQQQAAQSEVAAPSRLVASILLLTATRLIVNVVRRFMYPFVTKISGDLGVPATSIQAVIGLQAGVGLLGPAFGPLIERHGRKRLMVAVLFGMAGVSLVGAVLPQFGVFALVMLALGLGKVAFDATVLAYISDHVPYRRRGMALGTSELAWAGSFVMVSLFVGPLLQDRTLRGVMLAFCVAFALMGALLAFAIEGDRPHTFGKAADAPGSAVSQVAAITLRDAFNLIRRNPAALAALCFGCAISMANEILFINYSIYMGKFALDVIALGAATAVIPLAEALGELTVVGISDRFGKRRLTLISAMLACAMFFLLPHLNSSLPLAQVGLFVMFFATETTIVAAIPLFSQVLPDTRSVMMSSLIGAAALGRLSGSLVGGFLYGTTANFPLLGIVSACIGFFGTVMLWRFVKESYHSHV